MVIYEENYAEQPSNSPISTIVYKATYIATCLSAFAVSPQKRDIGLRIRSTMNYHRGLLEEHLFDPSNLAPNDTPGDLNTSFSDGVAEVISAIVVSCKNWRSAR